MLQKTVDELGYERVKHFHAHFSRIEYGPKGEMRHVNFSVPAMDRIFATGAGIADMKLEP